MAHAVEDKVAAEIVRCLGSSCSREELKAFLNQYDQELGVWALAAFDKLLYMPERLKAKDREQER
jgi:hypothetical protein